MQDKYRGVRRNGIDFIQGRRKDLVRRDHAHDGHVAANVALERCANG
jgi:hypothetical protein